MRRISKTAMTLFAVFAITAVLALVTSSAGFAGTQISGVSGAQLQQQVTPTPSDVDASVPGSTDGIVSMGIVIALIVLVPVLVSRATWRRQT